jgi:hypothetical protein
MKSLHIWPSLVVVGLLIVAISAAPVAAAGPPMTASGSFTQNTFVQSNVRSADGVTLFDFTETDTLTGTFSGTTLIQGHCVIQASGQGTCVARETLTGTAAGQSGTLEFADVIHISNVTTGAATGHFAVIGGSGDLAHVTGQGTFQGSGGSGTYSGRLIFGP